jgi:adenylate cyclase
MRKSPQATIPKPALKLIDWLAGEGCRDLDDAELVAELGTRLVRLGVPVDRLTLHLPTLHPQVFRRVIAWAPGEPVEIRDRSAGGTAAEAFHAGPLAEAVVAARPTELRTDTEAPAPWLDSPVFQGRGLTEFILVPLPGGAGPVSVICFATRRSHGFSEAAQTVIAGIRSALAGVVTLRALRRAAA